MGYILIFCIGLYMFLQFNENTSLKNRLNEAETAYKDLAKKYGQLVNDPYGNE